MARVLDGVDSNLAAWIAAQHVFFVATAPLSAEGHVNLSPKGFAGSFAVLGAHEVAFVDRIGSGAETIAHVRENQRITIMFCAFDGKPNIVRLHGKGSIVLADEPRFEQLAAHFEPLPRGSRSIVHVALDRVSDSCGFGVPLMDYVADRDTLETWVAKKSDDALVEYVAAKNARSIDGLPAVGSSS